jgi:hypothetical protein
VGNELWGGSDLHDHGLNVSPASVAGGPKVTVSWNGVAHPTTQDWRVSGRLGGDVVGRVSGIARGRRDVWRVVAVRELRSL